jgi:hypothetical protein
MESRWIGSWAARSACVAAAAASVAAASAPPPPPTPPPPGWHQPARCEEGDVNALFQFRGVWHLMQQWHLRPHTAVGHAVSHDLLTWQRVADVLQSGTTADEQCYDGSASLVARPGHELSPMLQIDGGCGRKQPGTLPCMESAGNGSTGGVTAWPDDLTDATLANWTKAPGPTVWHDCNGSAGPGPVWRNPHSGLFECIAIHGAGEARFVARDDTLHSWKMADPEFLPAHGGGGGLWHTLPPNAPGVASTSTAGSGDGSGGARWATHIFQSNRAMGDGRPEFLLGVYDPVAETFSNVTVSRPVDHGQGVCYGQLSHQKADDGAPAPAGADNRTIHVSWLAGRSEASTGSGAACATGGQLTSFRDLRYDPRIDALVELPIDEYYTLRHPKPTLNISGVAVKAGPNATTIADVDGLTAATMDLEVELAVPHPWPMGAGISIGVRCETEGGTCANGTIITLTSNGTLSSTSEPVAVHGGRAPTSEAQQQQQASERQMVIASVSRWRECVKIRPSAPSPAAAFPLLEGEDTVALRIMTDHRSIEIFAAGGRWVFSCGLGGEGGGTIVASSTGVDATVSAAGWALPTAPVVQ